MEKRYQVFVSSTYTDLTDERLEVMRAILELDSIPSGMEYFPANNDEQWSFIKELIDQCDYYIVILGARYGTLANDGLSYTEKEYRYAIEKGIPVAAFIHANPGAIPIKNGESDPEKLAKLNEFQKLVQQKLCKTWSTQAELGAVVSRSLTQLIKRNPRPGWVRSDQLASIEASHEILRLRQIIDKKDEEINRLSSLQSSSKEKLAHGEDQLEIAYTTSLTNKLIPYSNPDRSMRFQTSRTVCWDDLFNAFAPDLLTPTKISAIKSAIARYIKDLDIDHYIDQYPGYDITSVTISNNSLQLIILQFNALGFIQLTNTNDAEGQILKIACLTDVGKDYLINASAIKRGTTFNLPTSD